MPETVDPTAGIADKEPMLITEVIEACIASAVESTITYSPS